MTTSPVEILRSPLPRPEGSFRRLERAEAREAFVRARGANRQLLLAHDELLGYEIIEVRPATLGGAPEALENKRAVDRETHLDVVRFWARAIPPDEPPPAEGEPSPDYFMLTSADEHVMLKHGLVRLLLWPRELTTTANILGGDAARVFASDGCGTAFAWGRTQDGSGIFEVPFVPLGAFAPSFVAATLSDLLDRLEAGEL